MSRAAPVLGAILAACGPTERPAPVPPLGGDAAALVGPVASLERALSAWSFERDYTCEPAPDEPPAPRVRETARWTGAGPLLEARLVRVRGDVACAPIEYCVLAIRSAHGWWVNPADQNGWCSGVTGPSSRIETVDEPLAGDGARLVHRGLQRVHRRSYDEGPRGERRASWTESPSTFTTTCGPLADGRVGCRRAVRAPAEP